MIEITNQQLLGITRNYFYAGIFILLWLIFSFHMNKKEIITFLFTVSLVGFNYFNMRTNMTRRTY